MGFNESIFEIEGKQYKKRSVWTNWEDYNLRVYDDKKQLQFNINGRFAYKISHFLLETFGFIYSCGEDCDARKEESIEQIQGYCEHDFQYTGHSEYYDIDRRVHIMQCVKCGLEAEEIIDESDN